MRILELMWQKHHSLRALKFGHYYCIYTDLSNRVVSEHSVRDPENLIPPDKFLLEVFLLSDKKAIYTLFGFVIHMCS